MIQKNYTDDTEKIVMSLKMSLKHQNRVAENFVENTQFMKDAYIYYIDKGCGEIGWIGIKVAAGGLVKTF